MRMDQGEGSPLSVGYGIDYFTASIYDVSPGVELRISSAAGRAINGNQTFEQIYARDPIQQ